ncbi:MAG: protein transport protein HofB [Verrucomicrobiota bacterium]|jgi:type II secretory ATPase GspE/PulE/Tfp pilus assembly ATPase PilB-like protein|nr:protein transport protein HofB [Verrucomicrobiota bacterium]
MSHENPPRSDQFWMADPLNILIQTVLTKAFNLEESEVDVANGQVLQYIEFLSRSKTLEEAWQQRSFYELLVDNNTEGNALGSSHDLFTNIFRNNRHMSQAAIDFETYFPPAIEQVNIPPVPVPIVPISYRFKPGDTVAEEATVVTWIPGLELEMRTPYWAALNEFFAARRVSCLWAEPEAIRRFLATARQPLRTTPRLPREAMKGVALELSDKNTRPWIDLRQFVGNRALLQEFGLGRMQHFEIVPLRWEKPFLTLAVSKPLSPRDRSLISQGPNTRGTIFSEVLADKDLIKEWINREASAAESIRSFAAAVRVDLTPAISVQRLKKIDLQSLQRNVTNRQPEDVVEVTLAAAIGFRASDILFQSSASNRTLKIKFKSDGDWTEPVVLGDIGQNVLTYLKTQARLNTSRTERPQDGQFRREYELREYLFRINTTFNFQMETAILRLQPGLESIPSLEGLGMPPYICSAIRDFIAGPQGMLIFTGPAGSGKTTSIYAILKEQPASRMNIITGECPIEVINPDLTQDEISEGGRYTFPDFVRSLVRRQPSIAVIQEIRDAETGEALIGVFNTAVRVIASLHTNSAAHIPDRLEYFGVPTHYTASVLKMGIHQRLVRKLCPACPEEVPIPGPEYLNATGIKSEWLEEATTLLRGTGCPKCLGKGYIGRSPIFEALIVDSEIEAAITQKKSPREIRALMRVRGERTLFEQAVRLAATQAISLEEALQLRSAGE